MKRKKPPIALVSTLVVSVLGLIIASGAWKFYMKSPEEQAQQLQQEEIERQKAIQANQQPDHKTDGDKEVKAAADRLKTQEMNKPQSDNGPMPLRKATAPTVVMPELSTPKPVKNSSSTSSQWYDDK